MLSDKRTMKICCYGLCLAVALILSYVEALIPVNIGVPGAKIGLPNIVTVMLIYTAGGTAAFTVGVLRIILNGFLFGNLFAIAYSAAGFLFSFIAMMLIKRTGCFGVSGVSTIGGIMHNVGQICVAALITNAAVYAYLPVLIFAGALSGVCVGLIGGLTTKRVAVFLKNLA